MCPVLRGEYFPTGVDADAHRAQVIAQVARRFHAETGRTVEKGAGIRPLAHLPGSYQDDVAALEPGL